MFPAYAKIVDMFLLALPNTDTRNVHLSYFLVRRRNGSIDVTHQRLTAEKVPYFRAFRASGHQRQRVDLTVKIALSEHINRSVRRVEQAI